MKSEFKLYKEPQLRSPRMVAAWPGIGNIAIITVRYLQQKLGAEELGELEAFHLFDPTGVSIKDNVVEAPEFPESRFYYWQDTSLDNDIILFLGEGQPPLKGYELANDVLDVAQRFQVSRIYTCASAVTRIHYAENPKVWGAATNQQLVEEMEEYGVALKGDLHIAGLNGLLLGAARERGIEGICLLGEVPMYATGIPNPKASLAVLEIMSQMLGIKVDLAELRGWAEGSEEEMKRLAAEAMGDFIERFTKPIWEQEEEI